MRCGRSSGCSVHAILARVKTILVTGSTDGIGRATALALAERDCTVIVHGRNEERARRRGT